MKRVIIVILFLLSVVFVVRYSDVSLKKLPKRIFQRINLRALWSGKQGAENISSDVIWPSGSNTNTANVPDNSSTGLRLIFQSGYENSVGIPIDAIKDITGADSSFLEKNDWKADLEGHPNINNFWIFYEGGNPSQRYAKIITDPNNSSSKVLHFWLNDAYIPFGRNKLKGRIQATIEANNLYEMSMKHKLFLPEDMRPLANTSETFGWLTIQEFWNDPVNSRYPFRISVNLVKPSSTPGLYFAAHGQTKVRGKDAWEDVWSVVDNSFPIPIEEWITVKTYFKEGDSQNGQFFITVTDQLGNEHVVIGVTGYTHHPDDPNPDGLNKFNPMKLYAPDRLITPMRQNNKTLQLYWDDFELRAN